MVKIISPIVPCCPLCSCCSCFARVPVVPIIVLSGADVPNNAIAVPVAPILFGVPTSRGTFDIQIVLKN